MSYSVMVFKLIFTIYLIKNWSKREEFSNLNFELKYICIYEHTRSNSDFTKTAR